MKDNLIEVYDKLSYDYLHYSHELHENFKTLPINDMNDFFKKVYEKCNNSFQNLTFIYKSIYNSLENHASFINIGTNINEYIFEIENFDIKKYYPKSILKYKRVK